MAAVLGWSGGAMRSCVGRWVRRGLALIVGLVVSTSIAYAQAGGCSMPGQVCISGSSSGIGVDVSARQSGNGVAQSPANNVMNVLIPITIGVAAVGAAAVAIPATGAIAIAGDAIAAVGTAAIRNHVIQGVALAAVIAAIANPSGISMDASGNIVAPAPGGGYLWTFPNGMTDVSPLAVCQKYVGAGHASDCALGDSCGDGCQWLIVGGTGYFQATRSRTSCAAGYVMSGGQCVADPNAPPNLATDAQIQAAIAATPASWPSIYSGMNCGPTLALTNGSTSDPCYGLYVDSRTGFGVSFSTGGSSWTNNGCAVNSATCPSATVTTAPTTDTQTKTNADGSKTTTTNTTTKTTTVTGTNDRTNPVQSQTTTTTSTAVTVTNPDGSTTTTTTTTTDQAPTQTGTNGNQQQQDKFPPTTATFNGASQTLYTKKDKTFGQVLQSFVSRVEAMPWFQQSMGFFNVTVGGGSCPHWAVPASRWNPALDMTPYLCSQMMLDLYRMGGFVVIAVAAWAAFRIAFL